MGKWCRHASLFIFDRIIIKVAGNEDRHKSSDEFNFGPLVSKAYLYFFFFFFFFLRFDIGTLVLSLRFGLCILWIPMFLVFCHYGFPFCFRIFIFKVWSMYIINSHFLRVLSLRFGLCILWIPMFLVFCHYGFPFCFRIFIFKVWSMYIINSHFLGFYH